MVSFSLKLFINASKKLTLFWFVTSDRPYRNIETISTDMRLPQVSRKHFSSRLLLWKYQDLWMQ